MFSLELLYEVVDQAVVEVLTSQVSVTSGGLDLENALLDGKKGHIEGSSSQIEDENVALALNLLIETVGDGSSGGLVDNAENVETSDQTSVLGSLTLRISEVCRDCDDRVVDGSSQVGLGGLAHLD